MEYLRIEEDSTTSVVKGKDPEVDQEVLAEVDQGTLEVVRYRGNQFERMVVENLGPEDEEDEDGEDTYDVSWEAIGEAE